jgi:hypothetical protein
MDFINCFVCLSDIPAEARKKGKDGKVYVNLTVSRMKTPDTFNNTHTLYVRQTKEEREAKKERCYIGKGVGASVHTQPVSSQDVDNLPSVEDDDLPF